MKNIILLIMFLISSALHSQSFYSLDGIEDPQGNTILLYHLGTHNLIHSPVYKLDLNSNVETKIIDAFLHIFPHGESAKTVLDFEFFPGDTLNFINTGYTFGPDQHAYIARNDTVVYSGFSGYNIVEISEQNPDHVFVSIPFMQRSFDGGFTFLSDSVLIFDMISVSDYDDKVMFGIDSDNRVLKSDQGGYNPTIVHNAKIFLDENLKFIFDSNEQHVYRTNKGFANYEFYVSDSSGNLHSWTRTFYSDYPLKIAADKLQSGLVYLSDGKIIYQSTNYGYSFSEYRTLPRRVKGLYKKPGNDILYAATSNTIYKITPGEITVVKSIPFPWDSYKWLPLEKGNILVYDSYYLQDNTYPPSKIFAGTRYMEILSDTTIESKKYFRVENNILTHYIFHPRMYLRRDTTTNYIYRYWENLGEEFLFHDLNAEVGDTIFHPENPSLPFYYLVNETQVEYLGVPTSRRDYSEYLPCLCAHSLIKGFGLAYAYFNEFGGSEDILKGAVIGGVVYGDTSFVVSVEEELDQKPTEFKLHQNYPNPFNPITKIKYEIPFVGTRDRVSVQIKIYDVLGNEVATLVDEYKPAGSYEMEFNGSKLTSGIYFYRLGVGNYIDTKKMILMK